jgi:hypothetical protein
MARASRVLADFLRPRSGLFLRGTTRMHAPARRRRDTGTPSHSRQGRHETDPPAGPHRQRRRCAAVHLLLSPAGLHRGARRRVRGRGLAGGEGCDRADPHQFADVRGGPPAAVPGHGHRRRLRQARYRHALGGRDHDADRDDQRRRAPRVSRPGQQAPCVDPCRPRGEAHQHEGQHPRGRALRDRPRRLDRDQHRREGRRLGEQVEIRDAESIRFHRRVGAEDRDDDGPAGARRVCSASASAAAPRRPWCSRRRR